MGTVTGNVVNGSAAYSNNNIHIRLKPGEHIGRGNFICMEADRIQNDFLLSRRMTVSRGTVAVFPIQCAALSADAKFFHVCFKPEQAARFNDSSLCCH